MKNILLLSLFIMSSQSYSQADTITWLIDNLESINGHGIEIIGNPVVIETEFGKAIEFDGIDDGLIVDANPLAGATSFTVEIIFNPYTGGGVEQRFLHMQQDDNNRMLIELRNNDDEDWTLDTFIKSGGSNKALLDYNFTHELDEWAHAALVYQDGLMEHYVNGEKELEGEVNYATVSSGKTSLGVRMNQVSWYKGAILAVRVTHAALQPDEFMEIATISKVNDILKNEIDFEICPNPSTNYFELNFTNPKTDVIEVNILELEGKLISKAFKSHLSSGKQNIKLQQFNLESGIYLIELKGREFRKIKKWVRL